MPAVQARRDCLWGGRSPPPSWRAWKPAVTEPAPAMRASALLPLGIACCLPTLCAGKPSTDPQTADDSEGMAEVTVTARGDDPLAAQQNASAVELDGALLGSLTARLEDPLAVAALVVDPAATAA